MTYMEKRERQAQRLSQNLTRESLASPVNLPPRDGACKGHDVSMWFPNFDKETATSETYKQAAKNTKQAKEICESCDKKIECLAYGIQNEVFGIWGGMTERARKSLRRKFKIELRRRESIIGIQGMNIR